MDKGSGNDSKDDKENVSRAEELKNKANDLFKGILTFCIMEAYSQTHIKHSPSPPPSSAGKFEGAIELYSQAIELSSSVAVYYGNRSFAHLKTESYGYALSDASKALELDTAYIKVGRHQGFTQWWGWWGELL